MTSMAARTNIAMLVAAAALAAGPASAKVYAELRPRMTLLSGVDDNVALDGTGGDYFGRAQPGLKLDIFGEHRMHVNLDCQVGLARLGHPDRFSARTDSQFGTGEQCEGGYTERWSPRLQMHLRSRIGYMQDPLAISGLGLLLRPGQTQVFQGRLSGEAELQTSGRAKWTFGLGSQVLAFGANDPGNGGYVAPSVTYGYRTTPYVTWEVTGREQLFFGFGASPSALSNNKPVPGGLLTEAHTAMGGYVRRLSPVTTLTARAGASYVTGSPSSAFEPVAMLQIESATPGSGVHFLVMHDLAIGAARAGAIGSDLAELGLLGTLSKFEGHLRAGIYRNTQVGDWARLGALGYTGEADLDYRIGKEWTVGVAALRDARLTDRDVGQQVDRDVVQLRVTWERARN
ncbi:MAG: hypothetical protein ACJ783_07730 [Myxococcales bacterium]